MGSADDLRTDSGRKVHRFSGALRGDDGGKVSDRVSANVQAVEARLDCSQIEVMEPELSEGGEYWTGIVVESWT